MIIPGIRRVYPTYLIKTLSFANWKTGRKIIVNIARECLTYKEKDLRLTINANMKVSELGIIRRNVTYKENGYIVPLYKATARTRLEYCIHTWRPYRRNGIDMLEKYKGEQLHSFQGIQILATKKD